MRNGMRRRIAAACLLAMLAAGCSTPDIQRFATAGEKAADHAERAYESVAEAVRERRLAEIVANPGELPDAETFAPVLADRDLKARMALLRSLRSYAKGLRELATADHRAKIDQAAARLDRALRQLNREVTAVGLAEPGIADADVALFAIAVRRVGRGIGEARRRHAIRSAMAAAAPAVRQASALLAAELPELGALAEASMATVETELLAAYRAESAGLAITERMDRLRDIARRRELRAEAKAFFATAGRAAARLGEAHAAQKAVLDRDAASLPALAAALDDLEEALEDLQAFRQRWHTWKEAR